MSLILGKKCFLVEIMSDTHKFDYRVGSRSIEVTTLMYYALKLFSRKAGFSTILWAKRLFQLYIAYQYCKTEAERLHFKKIIKHCDFATSHPSANNLGTMFLWKMKIMLRRPGNVSIFHLQILEESDALDRKFTISYLFTTIPDIRTFFQQIHEVRAGRKSRKRRFLDYFP